MRRSASVAALAVLSVMLIGCSPGAIGTIGLLREDDGSLTALVRACRGSVETIVFNPTNSLPHRPDRRPITSSWRDAPKLEFTVGGPAAGTIDVAVGTPEPSLRPRVLYALNGYGEEGYLMSGSFSAADLSSLLPGEVLARAEAQDDDRLDDARDGSFVTVSEVEFESRAQDYCR